MYLLHDLKNRIKYFSGAPCLSFDIIKDELGTNRTEFPLTLFLVAGTQASKPKENCILIMKNSNLHKTQKLDSDEPDDEDDDDEEEENEEKRPRMDYASVAHYGCINRIRVGVHEFFFFLIFKLNSVLTQK